MGVFHFFSTQIYFVPLRETKNNLIENIDTRLNEAISMGIRSYFR